jgi:nucleotide-binding universal stress UspA family protein
MLLIRTVLYATDFSETSKLAFPLACALAQDYGARLIAVHVAQPPVVIYTPTGDMLPHCLDFRLAAQDLLRQLVAPEKVRVEYCVTEGDAGKEILRLARENHADLVVMGTHGRTGLDRLIVGSVAEEVLRKAACPVLTVKAPAAKSSSTPGTAAAQTALV